MTRAAALEAECPGVRGLVPQCVVLGRKGQVCRDRDAVRPSVDDFSSRQFASGEAYDGRAEAKSVRESVIEILELSLRVWIGNRKQAAHRTKISRFGRMRRWGLGLIWRQAEQEE